VSALASEVYTAGLLTGDAVAATIAHEVKQPLSGMITNADAGLRWLDRSTPNLDKAKAAFEQIVADGHRAAAVIESIRAIFRNDARNRTSLDVNEMIGDALALLRADLQKHRILVQAAQNAEVPQVRGDRIQLQQVLLNLITNAIDAMATKDGARILRFRSEDNDAGGVIVSVADNGPGIGRNSSSRYSIHYLPRNWAVWAWVCPSAGRSLRPMVAGCGLSRTNPRAPSFILCYWPTLRSLLVLQDEMRLMGASHLVRRSHARTPPT
jgi:hypothetical protein